MQLSLSAVVNHECGREVVDDTELKMVPVSLRARRD